MPDVIFQSWNERQEACKISKQQNYIKRRPDGRTDRQTDVVPCILNQLEQA